MTQHEIIQDLKRVQSEIGHTPSRAEYEAKGRFSRHTVIKQFGSFSDAVKAAGMGETILTDKQESKLLKQYKALCSKREPIQGFFRHVIDLEDLFERAGNPEVLKLSAEPDTHAKYVDRKAFNCYTKFLEYWKPHVHLIMGDFIDCEGLSHWEEDTLEPRRIVPEMKIGRALLDEIIAATPECSTRLYITGNHEDWIQQAFTRMPELFDGLAELDIEINLDTLLGLKARGYHLFPLNDLIQIGKAHFTHGLYSGQNHAKKHLDQLKTNIYYGHLHDLLEHNQTSVEGHMEAASLGCLCRLDAKFLKGKPNNWVHAHGTFEFFRDGSYSFSKQRIINGRMAYNGKVFEG